MRDATAAFLDLVAARQGHFRMESGYHSGLWLDLDPLFADASAIAPFLTALAHALERYDATVVCGPLLGGAFLAQMLARELHAAFWFTERVVSPDPPQLYAARYRLPPAFTERLRGQRIAVVDDVISAGSALDGTIAELQAHGARPVAAGALLVLGTTGVDRIARRGVPIEAAARHDYQMWTPQDCPLCASGTPVERHS